MILHCIATEYNIDKSIPIYMLNYGTMQIPFAYNLHQIIKLENEINIDKICYIHIYPEVF